MKQTHKKEWGSEADARPTVPAKHSQDPLPQFPDEGLWPSPSAGRQPRPQAQQLGIGRTPPPPTPMFSPFPRLESLRVLSGSHQGPDRSSPLNARDLGVKPMPSGGTRP